MKYKILIGILLCLLLVGSAQAVIYDYPFVPKMTSDNDGLGNISSAISSEGAGNEAWRAYDKALGATTISPWYPLTTNKGWVQIQTSTGHVAQAYNITALRSNVDMATTKTRNPRTWNFNASNDGSTWTTLDTQTDITDWPTANGQIMNKTFTFANTVSYTYYRLDVIINMGNTYLGVEEIEIFGQLAPTSVTPIASFTSTNRSIATNTTSRGWEGVSPFTMQFTNTSTGAPFTSYVWNATNMTGNSVALTFNQTVYYNPIYTFTTAGNYSIQLNVTGSLGTNISVQKTFINVSSPPSPTAIFTATPASGVTPLTVTVNDTSTGSPTMWNTSWGDLAWTNQTSFPATNITHIYSTAGSYTITHYATNAYGTGSATTTITVYGYANSQFSSFNTAGTAPFTTYLYDTSTNTTGGTNSWYWKLGDGNVSTAQNLYYTWNITGTYSVNHSFSNGLSTNWNNKSNYVTVGNQYPRQ